MALTYNSKIGNDSLRQECIGLLKNYVPNKDQKFRQSSITFANSSDGYQSFAQEKAHFRAKNEVYVQAVRNVVRLDRDAARQRNIQAFKNFLNDLIKDPVKEENIPTTFVKSSPKRKSPKSPKAQISKRRKLDQEFFLPISQQDAFYPCFQKTELSYQDSNGEILKQMELSQQPSFYQIPLQHPTNFYFSKSFNSGYYQQDPNNVYTYQG